MKRAAGILLHPTSLPSGYGIGDIGDVAFRWIDMLRLSGQTHWQFCPLGPVGLGDSPYQCVSSFAGNPLLVSPDSLYEDGLLKKSDIASLPALPADRVDYAAVGREKEKLFRTAFGRFTATEEFALFCKKESSWLDDYALFCAIKRHIDNRPWSRWETPLKMRRRDAMAEAASAHDGEIRFCKFLQFVFYRQWAALRGHAARQGIALIGDIPIYVALDSCDAWAAPHLFEFDKEGNPLRVSGVPPDYYCETGQLWGNPLYRWDVMKKDGYGWWISRIRKTLESADMVRLDHFRAFESFWAVKAGEKTAKDGEWVKGPGMDFFARVKKALGGLPFIAEDLGDITEDVTRLRSDAGLPGMKVMQFAFDANPANPHLPYNFPQHSVVYTGTHDNDTTAGWLESISGVERDRVCTYVGCERAVTCKDLIRLAYSSVASLCVIPLQDVLCLDSSARMNTPGRPEGNWRWRCVKDDFSAEKLAFVKKWAADYGRLPGKAAGED
jgi:4-alpha-glucanotransferase